MAAGAKPTVHLVDGHVWIFRAYYALPSMEAPDGTPTHAAYGFTNTLLRYLGERRPSHLAIAFDHALTSFRNDLDPGYKADRTDAPVDLEPQFGLCREAARALGVATFEREDYEADDVLATLATQLAPAARVVVVSSDKDLAQLVAEDGSVVLHDDARGRTLDALGVRARFGVEPARIPEYLGLMGDAVDSLPGVPGVGPKTASQLLAAFDSIEAIPEDPDAWAGLGIRGATRLAARVAEHRERACRSRDLATAVRTVPGVSARVGDLARREPDRAAAQALFGRLGWEGIARRALGAE